MATIKSTSQALGNLINQINNLPSTSTLSFPSNFGGTSSTYQQNNIGIDDDSIPANMLESQKEFEINYKSVKKQCNKKAKTQLEKIVYEIIPADMRNSAMITDKIQQDAEQLGGLYYEYEKTDLIVQSLMNTIGRGETQARLFEVYTKMSKMLQELSAQITDTQNTMRKNYIDTYLDIQQKDEAEADLRSLSQANEQKTLDYKNANNNNVIVGTDQISKMLYEKKKKALMAEYEEVE